MSEELLKKIAELEAKVKVLEKDLIHDSLTGLKTRAYFDEKLEADIVVISTGITNKRRLVLGFKELSVLFFDIDHFKNINDTYGHGAGDLVLKTVAETIKKDLRIGDVVARWGGEEIVASLLGATEVDAYNKADEVRKIIEHLSFDAHPDLKVTISIGVAGLSEVITPHELLARADKALYKAKRTGRNKVVSFSEL